MGENWLSTDTEREALAALDTCLEQISKIEDQSEYPWKWVIITLHSALQGFMVLALCGTNSINVMEKRSAEGWLRAYENHEPYPKNLKLDNFLGLYEKIKQDGMLMYVNSKKFVPTDLQEKSVRRLNTLRNEFVHFMPKRFSLALSNLPRMCLNCVDVIKFLVLDSGNMLLLENDGSLDALIRTLDTITQALSRLETKYGA